MARLPSLNALRAFEAVARLGSVSLAGGELSVTPGAVSRHIKELENDLGVTILERDGRGVRLTAEGKHLKNSLYPAFDMINKAVLRMRRDPRRRTLLVMTVPLFATSWLIPRLDKFRKQTPKIDIIVAERFTDADMGEADIVIEWGAFDGMADVIAERLTHEVVFPVCRPSVCPNRTLAGATLLHRHSFPNRYDFPDWQAFLAAVGLEGLAGAGVDAQPSISVSGGLVMNAARDGMGVALANTTIAYDDLASGRLVRPVDETMEIDIGYWLMTPRAVSKRSEVAAFRAWLLDELASSVGRTDIGKLGL